MKTRPLLKITLLDVGWGDGLFLESIDLEGEHHFALIDSNDTVTAQTTANYLKRFFRRHKHYVDKELGAPHFDFVLLSHDHMDHRAGLEGIVKKYGTREFWYPKSWMSTDLAKFISYADKQSKKQEGKVRYHEAVQQGKPLGRFGEVELEVLWPPEGFVVDQHTVNNSSVVLKLSLGKWSAVLTGDAEEEVWKQIGDRIPRNTRFFKVPHHGSINGTNPDSSHGWYHKCPYWARLGLSCDIRSTKQIFPSKRVIDRIRADKRKYFRTDYHHHVTFITDGVEYKVVYSH